MDDSNKLDRLPTEMWWTEPDVSQPNYDSRPPNFYLPRIHKYIRSDLVPQWQPIETVPDDGSEAIFLDKHGNISIGRAMQPSWAIGMVVDYVNSQVRLSSFTHWMPIPKVPE